MEFLLGLSDFVASQEKKFAVLLNSVILAKCFKCKLWENSRHVSKQLDKIGRYSRQTGCLSLSAISSIFYYYYYFMMVIELKEKLPV